jgi:signal peptidase I
MTSQDGGERKGPSEARGQGESGTRGRAKTRRVAGGGKKPEEEERGSLFENLRSIGIAVVLFLILRTFVLQTFFITSGSMEDTLLVGDFLVVNRAAVGSRIPFTGIRLPGYSSVDRGDIIVFDPTHEPDLKLVKRLIGLPGDTLEMRDGILFLNGQRQDEPYVKREGIPDSGDPSMFWQAEYLLPDADRTRYEPTRNNWGPLVIPEGRYFMLGDNRDSSLDSRYWGLLERWRLEGRVSFIYFSYNRGSYEPFPWLREIRWGRIFNGVE